MNPYKVLGVRKTADAAQIEKAFRRKVRALHPDSAGDGGDAAKLTELKLARDVLLDPARRERYDRDGVVEASEPDNARARLMSVLFPLFGEVMAAFQEQKKDPFGHDLADVMRKSVELKIKQLRDNAKIMLRAQQTLDAMRDRFGGDGGAMAEVLDGHKALLAKQVEVIDGEIEKHQSVLAELKAWRFRKDAPPVTTFTSVGGYTRYGGSSGTSTNW